MIIRFGRTGVITGERAGDAFNAATRRQPVLTGFYIGWLFIGFVSFRKV